MSRDHWIGTGTTSIPARIGKTEWGSYKAYLASSHWAAVKAKFRSSKLARRRPGCWCCGDTTRPTEIHHRTYKRLGRERLMDLIPLCRDCHHSVHDRVRRNGDRGLWGITNKVLRSGVHGRA